MWSLIIFAIWGVERADLDRFPPAHVAADQVGFWYSHLERLDRQETFYGHQWHDRYERWRQETRDIAYAWDLLWLAHFQASYGDNDWVKPVLLLRDHIGPAAYQTGWLQKYPEED
jgi:hypothetical protein